MRSREHRREPRGSFRRAHDLLLRRGHLLYASRLSPHALLDQLLPLAPEAFRRKSTFPTSTSPSPAHPMTGLSPSSRISVAAASCATMTRSCPARRCCSATPTSFSISIARLHSRRSTAISMISVSPTADAMETGDTCGRTRASRAGSWLQNGPCPRRHYHASPALGTHLRLLGRSTTQMSGVKG